MNHLDVEQVERLLDGEKLTNDDRWARVHVAECVECRDRLALAEREAAEIRSLLRSLTCVLPMTLRKLNTDIRMTAERIVAGDG